MVCATHVVDQVTVEITGAAPLKLHGKIFLQLALFADQDEGYFVCEQKSAAGIPFHLQAVNLDLIDVAENLAGLLVELDLVGQAS